MTTPSFAASRANLRRIVDRLDAVALLYPGVDAEPVRDVAMVIADDGDLTLVLRVNNCDITVWGDPMAATQMSTAGDIPAGEN